MPTRSSLRDLAIAALTAGVADVSGRVLASRYAPVPGASNAGDAPMLPALLVYADRIQREASAAYTQAVVVVLTVHVVAEAATEAQLESDLDSISDDVESIILSDSDLNAALEGVMQTQVERAVNPVGDRYTGQDIHQFALRWTEFI
jgi:hypothetical protein